MHCARTSTRTSICTRSRCGNTSRTCIRASTRTSTSSGGRICGIGVSISICLTTNVCMRILARVRIRVMDVVCLSIGAEAQYSCWWILALAFILPLVRNGICSWIYTCGGAEYHQLVLASISIFAQLQTSACEYSHEYGYELWMWYVCRLVLKLSTRAGGYWRSHSYSHWCVMAFAVGFIHVVVLSTTDWHWRQYRYLLNYKRLHANTRTSTNTSYGCGMSVDWRRRSVLVLVDTGACSDRSGANIYTVILHWLVL